ncbi:hypothetical protein [Telluribacter humicola]|uniref:hypothetical protein n=1 Tax=Telluribacter humicola TaxID=1720261 RepID=UPI001A972132|nr:hypothetical protein [Telluribacter humicola]
MKNVKKWMWSSPLLLLMIIIACAPKDNEVPAQMVVSSDFENGPDGWTGGFAEYSTSMDGRMEFDLSHSSLPAPLDQDRMALKIEGRNLSDNLFMFIKKKLTGLDPSRTYSVYYEIQLASDYATNSVGIGGSPATSVFLKAGASPDEPVKYLEDNYYMINIDKGGQSQGGNEMTVLGHVGAGEDVQEYQIIERSNEQNPVQVQPNANGELWLVVGTDSGFEGKTILYYDQVTAILR